MSNSNRFTVSLDNLPANEHIIFKLICSVSQKSKGRENQFYLVTEKNDEKSDIIISDVSNKKLETEPTSSPQLEAYVANDANSNTDNLILRPLIATRVLTALDNIISSASTQDISPPSDNVNDNESESPSFDFEITEEEASELAIVHDNALENPANEEVDNIAQESNSSVIPLIKSKRSESDSLPRALVVDDSPSVRKQLELELDLFAVNVDYVASAEEAFNLLEQQHYDIAFLDVVLPDKDGFQICKHIKSTSKETIAIMLTGKATQSDKIKGSLAGCDDYLVKPVGRNTFQSATSKYLSLKTTETYAEV